MPFERKLSKYLPSATYKNQRVKQLEISVDLIPNIFNALNGERVFKCDDVPLDSTVLTAELNWWRRTVTLLVQSETFDQWDGVNDIDYLVPVITELTQT